jgi:hypothetical protein
MLTFASQITTLELINESSRYNRNGRHHRTEDHRKFQDGNESGDDVADVLGDAFVKGLKVNPTNDLVTFFDGN